MSAAAQATTKAIRKVSRTRAEVTDKAIARVIAGTVSPNP